MGMDGLDDVDALCDDIIAKYGSGNEHIPLSAKHDYYQKENRTSKTNSQKYSFSSDEEAEVTSTKLDTRVDKALLASLVLKYNQDSCSKSSVSPAKCGKQFNYNNNLFVLNLIKEKRTDMTWNLLIVE